MGRSICSVDGSARARGGPLLLASRALRPSAMAGANVLVLRDGGLAFDVVITRLGRQDADRQWLPQALGLTLVTRFFEPERWNSNPLFVGAIEPGGALDRWNQSQRASGDVCVQEGDRLLSVNYAGRHDLIRIELRTAREVRMAFYRGPPRRAG